MHVPSIMLYFKPVDDVFLNFILSITTKFSSQCRNIIDVTIIYIDYKPEPNCLAGTGQLLIT